jgi:hypothetical protein
MAAGLRWDQGPVEWRKRAKPGLSVPIYILLLYRISFSVESVATGSGLRALGVNPEGAAGKISMRINQ